MRCNKISNLNTLSSKLKELEEQDKKTSKANKRQVISKISAGLKKIDTQKHFKIPINPGASF